LSTVPPSPEFCPPKPFHIRNVEFAESLFAADDNLHFDFFGEAHTWVHERYPLQDVPPEYPHARLRILQPGSDHEIETESQETVLVFICVQGRSHHQVGSDMC
jgi:hypothetical protein